MRDQIIKSFIQHSVLCFIAGQLSDYEESDNTKRLPPYHSPKDGAKWVATSYSSSDWDCGGLRCLFCSGPLGRWVFWAGQEEAQHNSQTVGSLGTPFSRCREEHFRRSFIPKSIRMFSGALYFCHGNKHNPVEVMFTDVLALGSFSFNSLN